jgi:hypothetical protein
MFGYTKNELRGKNVNMLIPSPVSQLHTGFIRNYVQSGVGKIIDKSVYQLVLCKDKRCVQMEQSWRPELRCCLDCRLMPVVLAVTRVSGVGEDSTFLGSIEVRRIPRRTEGWN